MHAEVRWARHAAVGAAAGCAACVLLSGAAEQVTDALRGTPLRDKVASAAMPGSQSLCRFCQYPQELTLRLEAAARLTQIQLLSHEFKIVGKVELLVGTFEGPGGGAMSGNGSVGIPAPSATAADPSKATWRRLGFLAFDTNEGSGFSARELKSVALNGVPAQLLRLVIHRCHANAANAYGQVG